MINTYRCRPTKLEDLLRFKCEPSRERVYQHIITNIEYTKYMLDNSFTIEDSSNNELIALVDSARISHFIAAVGVLFSAYFVQEAPAHLRKVLQIVRNIVDSIQKTHGCSLVTAVNENIKAHFTFAKLMGFDRSDIDCVSELYSNSKLYYRNLNKCH